MRKNGATAIHDESIDTKTEAGVEARFEHDQPYKARVTIEGTAPLLCHRYDCDEVEAKALAPKGSKGKKSDNVESYLYRVPETNEVGIPAKNLKSMLASKRSGAGRSFQDPRSKRKNACELWQASLFVEPQVASLGKKTWDFLDRSRQCVQNAAVARVRPGFSKGWTLTFIVNVVQPSLLPPEELKRALDYAGAFVGLGDSRPDFGRFTVVRFETKPFVSQR